MSALVVDARTHAQRGGEIAAKAADRLKVVLTMGKADFGRDLVAAAERIGEASAVNLAAPDDYAVINYTGGTTGKSKGAIRRHRSTAAMTTAVAADFEFPETPRYLAAAPITHVAGTKVVPALLKGGTVHLMKGFDPERFLDTLEREKINFTLLVAHDGLCAARSSQARQDRSLLAGADPLWRLADVADAAGRGAGAHRPGVQPALRPDRVLSGERAPEGRPRCEAARAVRLLRLPDRLLQRDPARRGQQRGGAGRGGRDLRARAARDGTVLEAAGADRRDLSRAAGCTPATSPAPTSAATSISSIARRT